MEVRDDQAAADREARDPQGSAPDQRGRGVVSATDDYAVCDSCMADHEVVEVTFYDDGSIVVLTPQTDEAREWITNNVQTEEYQWLGTGMCVERKYVGVIIEAMNEAGFSIERSV